MAKRKPNYRKLLGANIRRLAEDQGKSLSQVSEEADVARSHFYAVVQGEKDVTLGWLEKVADVLETDLLVLLSDNRK